MSYVGYPFTVGDRVSYQQDFGEIKLIDAECDLAAILFDNRRLVQFSLNTLLEEYQSRQLSIINPIKPAVHGIKLSQRDKNTINYREAYCKTANQHPHPTSEPLLRELIPKITAEYKFAQPPGFSTVQRWFHDWVIDKFDMSLQVIRGKNGKRAYRVSEDIEDVIAKCINEIYLKQGKSKKAVIKGVTKLLESLGYDESDFPCDKTIRNRIKDVNRLEVEQKRIGELAARELMRGTYQHHEDYPCCGRVELDAAHLNIGLLDEDGYFVGGLSIAIVIDVGTRCILGFALLVDKKKKEDEAFVLASLIFSVSKKRDKLYPYGGIGAVYVRDSGPGYRSQNFNKFIENTLKSNLIIAPTRKGWAKPFVEGFVKTFRGLFDSEVDGYVGKYDPAKYTETTLIQNAKYTVKQMEKKVYEIIRDIYHHEPHEGLKNRTPHQVWLEKSAKRPPLTLDVLPDKMMLRPKVVPNRKLHHVKGITYKYQWFNSPDLQKLFHQLHGNRKTQNITLTIEVNDYDARWINVIHPYTGERIELPNILQLVNRITYDELNAFRSGVQLPMEVEARIDTEKRIKLRGTNNRRGPSTEVINSNDSVDWDSLYRPGESPHISLSESDKLKHKDDSTPTAAELPHRATKKPGKGKSRYQAASEPDVVKKDTADKENTKTTENNPNQNTKPGGFDIV